MHTIIVVFSGLLGLIIGSFLNVVIFRMNTGKGLGGRSMCLSCDRTLAWHELIPVLSYLFQKGKCTKCHSKISWQYPLVEMTTAVLFAGATIAITKPFLLAVWLIVVSLGVVISAYDIKHKMIPFNFLIAFGIVGLFTGVHIIAAVLVSLPFLIIWAISKGKWIGFGDVEIMAIMGLMLGIGKGFSALMIGFWIAALIMVPIVAYYRNKRKPHDPEIPFGPFLLFALYVVGITGFNIFSFITRVIQ